MAERPITFAVHKKPAPVCECNHLLGFAHTLPDGTHAGCLVDGCPCTAFRRKGALRKGTKRKLGRRATKAELMVAGRLDYFHPLGRWEHDGRPGRWDLRNRSTEDDSTLDIGEVKNTGAKSLCAIIDQARHYAALERGNPRAVGFIVDKPRPGERQRIFAIEEIEDWAARRFA